MGLFTSFGAVVNITYMHVVMCVAGPIKGLEWWLSYIPRNWKNVALNREEWAKLLKKARAHQGLSNQ